MVPLSHAARAFALLAFMFLGMRALPAAAAGDQTAALAQRAVSMWAQPPAKGSFAGFDGDDGFDRWQAAYPDDGLFAYRHVLHIAGRPDVVDSAGPRFLLAEYRAAFPDMTLTVGETRVDGDRATVHWTLRGTSVGAFDGLAPTGRPFADDGTFVFRTAGDQIVETWVDARTDDALRQAGAMPALVPQPWNPPAPIAAPVVPAPAPSAPDQDPYTAA